MTNEVEVVVSDKYLAGGGFSAAQKGLKDLRDQAKGLDAAFSGAGQSSSDAFEGISNDSKKVNKDLDGLHAQALKLNTAFDGLNDKNLLSKTDLKSVMDGFSSGTATVNKELDGLHAQAVRLNAEFDKSKDKFAFSDIDFKSALNGMRELGNEVESVTDSLNGSGGKSAGGSFVSNLTDGLKGVGPAFEGALLPVAAALAPAAMVAIGAAAGAGVVTGFGLGIAGLGLAFASQSDAVVKRFEAFKRDLGKDMATLSKPFQDTWNDFDVQARDAFDGLKPALAASFAELHGPVSDFNRDFLSGVQKLAPALEPLSKAFGAILDDIGPRLPKIFSGVSEKLQELSASIQKNPQFLGDMVEGIGNVTEGFLWMAKVGTESWDDLKAQFTGGSSRIDDVIAKTKELNETKLDQLKSQYSDVYEDAVTRAQDQIEKLKKATAIDIGSPLTGVFSDLADTLADVNTRGDALISWLDVISGRTPDYEESIQALNDGARAWSEFAKEAAHGTQDWGDALVNMDGTVNTTTENGSKFQDMLMSTRDELANTAASTRDLEAAGMGHDAAVQKVTEDMNGQIAQLQATWSQMGITEEAQQSLLAAYGLTPANIDTMVRLGGVDAARAALNSLVATEYKTIYAQVVQLGGYTGTVDGATVFHDRLAHGGIASTAHAATGGARSGDTVMNEHGGEAVRLPNGSTVMPAGATRALEERWASGGGGDGGVVLQVQPGRMSGMERIFLSWVAEALQTNGGMAVNGWKP